MIMLGEPSFGMQISCGCSDTITKKIVVLVGEGPKIETDCCYGIVCAGDTSYFCTPSGCPCYDSEFLVSKRESGQAVA